MPSAPSLTHWLRFRGPAQGAVSEKIVPSNHSSHQHPEAIEEVNRILKQHLKGRRSKTES
ncbi:MAG: hypothetical protein FJ385_09680 [Verrucomicrobia bacterium]|nr:hypothetical protein [Verrucomicrobiota bacterium]